MERYNIKVIRFKNSEIEANIEKVVIVIKNTVNQLLTSPPWGI
jgi:very-short-patch-repair endonuclease